jgi:hypothetical protein
MAVSKRLRYEILRRDNHACRYCGASAPDVPLRVDHVTPVALGGSDKPENLVTSCEPCNSGKSSATVDSAIVADVDATAVRWADAMKQAAENLRQQQTPKGEYRAAFLAEWNRWGHGEGEARTTVELPADWKPSIERFRVAGLPAEVWGDIVDTAMGYEKVLAVNKFKYCCGIAWNKVTELQAEARRIVGASPATASLDVRKSVLDAAFTIWHCGLVDNEQPPTAEQADEFRQSLDALSDWDLCVHLGQIIEAAQHATHFGISDIAEALKDLDRSRVWDAWISAWPKTYVPGETDDPWSGRYVGGPSDEVMERVKAKIRKLVDDEWPTPHLTRAAAYAGFHKSTRIYRGIPDEASGEHTALARALELWRVAFAAADEREPSLEEIRRFLGCLQQIGEDGGFALADIYDAAATAGAYQVADLSGCLPRQQSVFETAARPLAQSF